MVLAYTNADIENSKRLKLAKTVDYTHTEPNCEI